MRALRAGVTTPLAPNARLRFDALARCLDEVGASGSFLEVGCGQGAAATVLAGRFDYVGYEPDPTSYETARRRLVEVGAGTVFNGMLPPDPDRAFDVVGAFEVLEHIEDDHMAAAGWVRWLRPGGHLVISVPAHPERFASADVVAGHFRRYTRESLTEVLETAGLVDVEVVAYGWPLGYLLEWGRNRIAARRDGESVTIEDRTAASGRHLQPAGRLAPVIWAGTLPFRWMQRPFASGDLGTGFLARGRRPA